MAQAIAAKADSEDKKSSERVRRDGEFLAGARPVARVFIVASLRFFSVKRPFLGRKTVKIAQGTTLIPTVLTYFCEPVGPLMQMLRQSRISNSKSSRQSVRPIQSRFCFQLPSIRF
jgi:hypothetical protein